MGKNDVREAVESELEYDPLVDAANIAVKVMNGSVALDGKVPSYPQCLEAARAARRIAGVTSLHNHLEVVLPPEGYRDDAALTTAANNALAANGRMPDAVEAMARNGDLRLTGTVNYGYQRAAAELAVVGLIGVRHINNKIEVT
jgi:osmotically-inducible protein OsmY